MSSLMAAFRCCEHLDEDAAKSIEGSGMLENRLRKG